MDHEWQEVANNIDHEFFCVRGLKPESNFHFRLRALNKFGWGGYSVPSPTVRTRKLGQSRCKHKMAESGNGLGMINLDRKLFVLN